MASPRPKKMSLWRFRDVSGTSLGYLRGQGQLEIKKWGMQLSIWNRYSNQKHDSVFFAVPFTRKFCMSQIFSNSALWKDRFGLRAIQERVSEEIDKCLGLFDAQSLLAKRLVSFKDPKKRHVNGYRRLGRGFKRSCVMVFRKLTDGSLQVMA